jgi:hypothetical protein
MTNSKKFSNSNYPVRSLEEHIQRAGEIHQRAFGDILDSKRILTEGGMSSDFVDMMVQSEMTAKSDFRIAEIQRRANAIGESARLDSKSWIDAREAAGGYQNREIVNVQQDPNKAKEFIDSVRREERGLRKTYLGVKGDVGVAQTPHSLERLKALEYDSPARRNLLEQQHMDAHRSVYMSNSVLDEVKRQGRNIEDLPNIKRRYVGEPSRDVNVNAEGYRYRVDHWTGEKENLKSYTPEKPFPPDSSFTSSSDQGKAFGRRVEQLGKHKDPNQLRQILMDRYNVTRDVVSGGRIQPGKSRLPLPSPKEALREQLSEYKPTATLTPPTRQSMGFVEPAFPNVLHGPSFPTFDSIGRSSTLPAPSGANLSKVPRISNPSVAQQSLQTSLGGRLTSSPWPRSTPTAAPTPTLASNRAMTPTVAQPPVIPSAAPTSPVQAAAQSPVIPSAPQVIPPSRQLAAPQAANRGITNRVDQNFLSRKSDIYPSSPWKAAPAVASNQAISPPPTMSSPPTIPSQPSSMFPATPKLLAQRSEVPLARPSPTAQGFMGQLAEANPQFGAQYGQMSPFERSQFNQRMEGRSYKAPSSQEGVYTSGQGGRLSPPPQGIRTRAGSLSPPPQGIKHSNLNPAPISTPSLPQAPTIASNQAIVPGMTSINELKRASMAAGTPTTASVLGQRAIEAVQSKSPLVPPPLPAKPMPAQSPRIASNQKLPIRPPLVQPSSRYPSVVGQEVLPVRPPLVQPSSNLPNIMGEQIYPNMQLLPKPLRDSYSPIQTSKGPVQYTPPVKPTSILNRTLESLAPENRRFAQDYIEEIASNPKVARGLAGNEALQTKRYEQLGHEASKLPEAARQRFYNKRAEGQLRTSPFPLSERSRFPTLQDGLHTALKEVPLEGGTAEIGRNLGRRSQRLEYIRGALKRKEVFDYVQGMNVTQQSGFFQELGRMAETPRLDKVVGRDSELFDPLLQKEFRSEQIRSPRPAKGDVRSQYEHQQARHGLQSAMERQKGNVREQFFADLRKDSLLPPPIPQVEGGNRYISGSNAPVKPYVSQSIEDWMAEQMSILGQQPEVKDPFVRERYSALQLNIDKVGLQLKQLREAGDTEGWNKLFNDDLKYHQGPIPFKKTLDSTTKQFFEQYVEDSMVAAEQLGELAGPEANMVRKKMLASTGFDIAPDYGVNTRTESLNKWFGESTPLAPSKLRELPAGSIEARNANMSDAFQTFRSHYGEMQRGAYKDIKSLSKAPRHSDVGRVTRDPITDRIIASTPPLANVETAENMMGRRLQEEIKGQSSLGRVDNIWTPPDNGAIATVSPNESLGHWKWLNQKGSSLPIDPKRLTGTYDPTNLQDVFIPAHLPPDKALVDRRLNYITEERMRTQKAYENIRSKQGWFRTESGKRVDPPTEWMTERSRGHRALVQEPHEWARNPRAYLPDNENRVLLESTPKGYHRYHQGPMTYPNQPFFDAVHEAGGDLMGVGHSRDVKKFLNENKPRRPEYAQGGPAPDMPWGTQGNMRIATAFDRMRPWERKIREWVSAPFLAARDVALGMEYKTLEALQGETFAEGSLAVKNKAMELDLDRRTYYKDTVGAKEAHTFLQNEAMMTATEGVPSSITDLRQGADSRGMSILTGTKVDKHGVVSVHGGEFANMARDIGKDVYGLTKGVGNAALKAAKFLGRHKYKTAAAALLIGVPAGMAMQGAKDIENTSPYSGETASYLHSMSIMGVHPGTIAGGAVGAGLGASMGLIASKFSRAGGSPGGKALLGISGGILGGIAGAFAGQASGLAGLSVLANLDKSSNLQGDDLIEAMHQQNSVNGPMNFTQGNPQRGLSGLDMAATGDMALALGDLRRGR